MMIQITFNYYGNTVKGILLGKYQGVHELHQIIKKKFFGKVYEKHKVKKTNSPLYIIFIPWKHQIKEIVEIDENYVLEIDGLLKEEDWIYVDSYTSSVLEHNEYEVSIKVKNFNGYKFIYDDNEFIANIRNGLTEYCLETLYNNLPSIIEEEFDEDTAIRDNPMFLTYKEIEGQGTGFIELQYCKRNLPRSIALNKINHWEKDSLYIDVPCALSIFLDQYFDIFKSVNKNSEDVYSPEYFTLKQVIELRERLLELTPIDYRILVRWLDVCIDKGYSMYFLGV